MISFAQAGEDVEFPSISWQDSDVFDGFDFSQLGEPFINKNIIKNQEGCPRRHFLTMGNMPHSWQENIWCSIAEEEGFVASACDTPKEKRCLEILAEQDYSLASFVLGMAYLEGEENNYKEVIKERVRDVFDKTNINFIKQDAEKAIYWLEKSAEGGFKNAQLALGRIYEYGAEGIEADPVKSKYWYHKERE